MLRSWKHPTKTIVALACVAAAAISMRAVWSQAADSGSNASPAAQQINLFDGMQNGDLQVRYVPKNDREAQIIVKNNTQQPLSVKLPDAFAGVPVLAQVGGGGGANRGGTSSSSSGSHSGSQTSGGGGGKGGGGGGGVFSVAPEAVSKVKVSTVCLEHGKADPNDHVPYEIRPIESVTSDGRVQELLKMLGNGQIDQRAAQAAAWHFTNNMSWKELAAKKLNSIGAQPYFTQAEIKTAMALADRSEELVKGQMGSSSGAGKSDSPTTPMSPGDAADMASQSSH